MASAAVYFICSVYILSLQYRFTESAKDKILYCGACKAIIDEVEYSISKIDPNKKISVGSFRLDAKGKTKAVQVSYSRSQLHLSELLEDVCSKMTSYAESKSEDGKRKYIRTNSRDGEAIELKNVSINRSVSEKLKFAVPLARSEGQITELLEKVCQGMTSEYVIAKDKDTGVKRLKRMITRDGKMSSDIDFTSLMSDAQNAGDKPPDADSKTITFACESIIEEHEDDILELLGGADKDAAFKICSEIGEYCEEDEFENSSKDEL